MEDGKLKVIGSGSLGNAYVLTCGEDRLLLECGCNYDSIIDALDYNLDHLHGVLITHTHGDHLSKKTVIKMKERGVKVYGTDCEETRKAEVFTHLLFPKEVNKIGPFKVRPLPVPHGATCFAYVIEHEKVGKILFATDMSDFPYVVHDLRHLFIEANYSEEYVMDNASRGEMRSQPDKHMEIGHTINIIKRLKANSEGGDGIMTCLLIHLSPSNSNAIEFKERVVKEAMLEKDRVWVAEKNLCIYLQKYDY